MEDTPSELYTKTFQKQLHILHELEEKAQKIIDYETAHNPSYLHAISKVEEFLKKSERICYGGQAINAHLPKKLKIYNPDYDLPDYDFFSPDVEKDLRDLYILLEKEGFTDIHSKEGIHEGTIKLYVLYIPVADITYMDKRIYEKLHKEAKIVDGIYYTDINFLRMNMHLELSRPRGMVERWDKVFERLLLLNQVSHKSCYSKPDEYNMKLPFQRIILDFIKLHERIFAGADVFTIIKKKIKNVENLIIFSKHPIIFYSPTINDDCDILLKRLRKEENNSQLKQKKIAAISDVVPNMNLIYENDMPIAIIVEETACHSYIKSHNLRIASVDTLITLFLSLRYIRMPSITSESILCLVESLTNIQKKIRLGKHLIFPAISLECSGNEASYPALLKARKERLKKHTRRKSKSF